MSGETVTSAPAQVDSHLHTGDLQTIQAAYRLNGQNYLKWSQLVRTYLKGKGKISHILGLGPELDDPGFDAWDEEDSMIMSWLWSSMTPEISDTCMFLPSARGIWDAVQQTYSRAHDAARVYEVKVKTLAAKQGSRSVTEYANLLQNLWHELNHYRVLEPKCSDDAVILKNFIERDRVYDFLVGLNTEFDQVRIQILGKEEVPPLNEVIALVRAEESRRGIMLEPKDLEGSAMVAREGNYSAPKGRDSKDNLWCTYCKKPRHTRDRCWKLHGKPSTSSKEWVNRGDPRAVQQANNVSTISQQSQGPFNEQEIERQRRLLGTLKPESGSSSVALSSA